MTYVIRYEKPKCIGSAACEASNPEHFKVMKDGKAMLLGGKEVAPGIFEKEISDEQAEQAKIAVMGCPPKCIHLLKDGKEVDVW